MKIECLFVRNHPVEAGIGVGDDDGTALERHEVIVDIRIRIKVMRAKVSDLYGRGR